MNEVTEDRLKPDSVGLIMALNPLREKVLACIQCGTCSASCPNLFAMDYTPRQLWRLLMISDAEAIFHSRTFSLCSSCYYCTLRCPRNLPLTEVMAELKQIGAPQGLPDTKTTLFYRSFLESVKRHGRVRETEFMTLYLWALKDIRRSFQFAPLGWKLLRRGKITFRMPTKGKGRLVAFFRKTAHTEEQGKT